MRVRVALLFLLSVAGCGGGGGSQPPGPTAPTITGFAPTTGVPGTAVTVTGTGFGGATMVSFNGIPTGFVLAGETSLSTVVPVFAASGPIRVTTPGGVAVSSAAFTVPPPFWTTLAPAGTQSLLGLTWSGTQLVAVGGNGAILTSPDASTWTSRFSGTSHPLFGVAWSGTRFVAVGGWGSCTLVLLTSSDGVAWAAPCITPQQCSPPGQPPVGCGCPEPNGGLHAVVWSGTQFVAVGKLIYGQILVSPDGTAGSWIPKAGGTPGWQTCSCPACVTAPVLWAVGWSGSTFVAAGESGVNNQYDTSPDGATWTVRSFNASGIPSATITGIASAGGLLVAVGYGGTILLSNDGINWQAQLSGTGLDLYGVAWTGSRFVAVGRAGVTLTSPNGMDWTVEYSGTVEDINAVVWAGDRLVAVGYLGMVLAAP